jgi:hypothetical protein
MAINPVSVIQRARVRLARIAALSALARFVAPAATALALAALMPAIAEAVAHWPGYVLRPGALEGTRLGLVLVAAAMVATAAFRGWRAYRGGDDFVGAANRIDEHLGARQQVVTLATLADPAHPEWGRAGRSSLFPVLWRNVMAVLGRFEPEKEFHLEVRDPLRRSSVYAALVAAGLGLAMLALTEPATPLQTTALRLTEIARKIERTSTGPGDRALAAAVRKTAEELVNPKIPPEEKLKQLADVKRQIEKRETGAGKSAGASGAGAGSASSASASGKGQGQGQGAGKGEGRGKGGSGPGEGATKAGPKKAGTEIELRNELARAEVQVETEKAESRSGAKPGPEKTAASALSPGKNPNLKGGGIEKNKPGPAPLPVPGGAEKAQQKPNASGTERKGAGAMGNTHLGEFPKPAKYQRYLKPGEKGAAVNITDARYVMFRLPSAIPSGEGGKTVTDTEAPKARTPYTNAPLELGADTSLPDEQQLIPPRYRDLIR